MQSLGSQPGKVVIRLLPNVLHFGSPVRHFQQFNQGGHCVTPVTRSYLACLRPLSFCHGVKVRFRRWRSLLLCPAGKGSTLTCRVCPRSGRRQARYSRFTNRRCRMRFLLWRLRHETRRSNETGRARLGRLERGAATRRQRHSGSLSRCPCPIPSLQLRQRDADCIAEARRDAGCRIPYVEDAGTLGEERRARNRHLGTDGWTQTA